MAIGQPQMITQANHHQDGAALLHINLLLHLIMSVQAQVDSPPVVPPQSSCCTDKVDNVLSQSNDEYLDTQAVAWTSDENMSNYEFDNNHLHPSVDGRVPTAPGKPGKMVTVFPAWKNPGIWSVLPNILEK